MDPRHEPTAGADTSDVNVSNSANADAAGADVDGRSAADATPEPGAAGQPTQAPAGQSSGADTLTLSLFGVMVIIASVCLVIW